jgi:hypothetical protein
MMIRKLNFAFVYSVSTLLFLSCLAFAGGENDFRGNDGAGPSNPQSDGKSNAKNVNPLKRKAEALEEILNVDWLEINDEIRVQNTRLTKTADEFLDGLDFTKEEQLNLIAKAYQGIDRADEITIAQKTYLKNSIDKNKDCPEFLKGCAVIYKLNEDEVKREIEVLSTPSRNKSNTRSKLRFFGNSILRKIHRKMDQEGKKEATQVNELVTLFRQCPPHILEMAMSKYRRVEILGMATSNDPTLKRQFQEMAGACLRIPEDQPAENAAVDAQDQPAPLQQTHSLPPMPLPGASSQPLPIHHARSLPPRPLKKQHIEQPQRPIQPAAAMHQAQEQLPKPIGMTITTSALPGPLQQNPGPISQKSPSCHGMVLQPQPHPQPLFPPMAGLRQNPSKLLPGVTIFRPMPPIQNQAHPAPRNPVNPVPMNGAPPMKLKPQEPQADPQALPQALAQDYARRMALNISALLVNRLVAEVPQLAIERCDHFLALVIAEYLEKKLPQLPASVLTEYYNADKFYVASQMETHLDHSFFELIGRDALNRLYRNKAIAQPGPSQPRVFRGNPAAAVNATPEELNKYVFIIQVLDLYKDRLSENEYRHAKSTLLAMKNFHQYNREICTELVQSGRTKSAQFPNVVIHPEQADLKVEERAPYFFNLLNLAYDTATDQRNEEILIQFFQKAFGDLHCLEAASRMITQWHSKLLRELEVQGTHQLAVDADQAIYAEIEPYIRRVMEFDPIFEGWGVTPEEAEQLHPTNATVADLVWQKLQGKVGADGVPITLEKVKELVEVVRPQ